MSYEERVRIEAEIKEHIQILTDQKSEMEKIVSEYMEQHLEIFDQSFDQMEIGILEKNSDLFIGGNNMIQELLGRKSQFSSQEEFDGLMNVDNAFVL